MFFQLPEFEKMTRNIQTLENNKKNLQQLVTMAYSPDQKVNCSLQQTIQAIMNSTLKDLQQLNNLQNQVENGFMIPQKIYISELLYDRDHMPEWFEFVFEKEFLKQKKNFDIVAKKSYKMQGLRQRKQQLQLQTQSFRLLYERFQALNGKQKQALNIMSQAQSLKNKMNLVKQKFANFCQLIASKITNFLEQNCHKALMYHGQIQDYAEKDSYPERGSYNARSPTVVINDRVEMANPSPYLTNGGMRSSLIQERAFMKSSMPLTTTGYTGDRLLSVQSPTRTCTNHFRRDPSLRSMNERPLSVATSAYGFGNSNPPLMRTGFNYRSQMPRYYNTSISNYQY